MRFYKAKLTCWFDEARQVPFYGLRVKRFQGDHWRNLAKSGAPVFFDLRCDAEGYVHVLLGEIS